MFSPNAVLDAPNVRPKYAVGQIEFDLRGGVLIGVGNAAEHIVRGDHGRSRKRQLRRVPCVARHCRPREKCRRQSARFHDPCKEASPCHCFQSPVCRPPEREHFHCDKGPRLNRPCPVPHYSTNTGPGSNRKIPVSCKLLGHCGSFAPTQAFLLNRLAGQAFLPLEDAFSPLADRKVLPERRTNPAATQTPPEV